MDEHSGKEAEQHVQELVAYSQDGADGISCWDLNENGEKDVETEDVNEDTVVDVLDCRGADGEDGEGWDETRVADLETLIAELETRIEALEAPPA